MTQLVTRSDYRAMLARLPIENPTEDDMAAVCPHLTKQQAVAALTSETDARVACPGLRVKGTFHIVSYHDSNETKPYPPRLQWSHAVRIANTTTHFRHAAEAVAFSQSHWGDHLVEDAWSAVLELFIDDAAHLYPDGHFKGVPKRKSVLYMGLAHDWEDIMSDTMKLGLPTSELIDRFIQVMTDDHIIGHEIECRHPLHMQHGCAHCGGGLQPSSCSTCGHQFRDDHNRSGWDTPLSLKMVLFLRNRGHVFAQDPAIARAMEKERYMTNAR